MAPANKSTGGSVVKMVVCVLTKKLLISYLLPSHNLSLGMRAECEDLGLTAELRSLVATLKVGPADYVFDA